MATSEATFKATPEAHPPAMAITINGAQRTARITALRRENTVTAPTSLDHLPLMLTVDEAADILRVSRTTAYKLAELHRQTNGATGLPHVRLGSRMLVRRVDLAEIVGLPPSSA